MELPLPWGSMQYTQIENKKYKENEATSALFKGLSVHRPGDVICS